jgi:hypothetical protein
VSISPLSIAEDETDDTEVEIDEETFEETEIMNCSVGAEIRLLQLEKAIIKNIFLGNETISVLSELDYDTTLLEAILAELEFLLLDVQAADPNATDAVQVFVDLKSDAKDLTEEFRDSLSTMLDDGTLEELRERIRLMTCEQVQNLSKKIENRIRTYNRNQLHRLYGSIGLVSNSFLDRYEKGNISKEEVKSQIRNMLKNMTKEKRYQIFSELKTNGIRTRIQSMICVQNTTNNFTLRKQLRIQHRLQYLTNSQFPEDSQVRKEMQYRMENRLDDVDNNGSGSGNNGDSGNGSDNSKKYGGGVK